MENKRDFLEGDYSFKNWFKIMWKNGYIFIFFLCLSFIIGLLTNKDSFETNFDFGLSLAIPIITLVVVVYKGFIQFWIDLKNGRSR